MERIATLRMRCVNIGLRDVKKLANSISWGRVFQGEETAEFDVLGLRAEIVQLELGRKVDSWEVTREMEGGIFVVVKGIISPSPSSHPFRKIFTEYSSLECISEHNNDSMTSSDSRNVFENSPSLWHTHFLSLVSGHSWFFCRIQCTSDFSQPNHILPYRKFSIVLSLVTFSYLY